MANAISIASRIAVLAVVGFATNSDAQDNTRQRQGEAIVTQKCASCHSVKRSGDSPNPEAPALRTLNQRYPIESLEEALAEGTIANAPGKPDFQFSGKDVGAIIAYMNSIQDQRVAAR
jgi:cytochrome c